MDVEADDFEPREPVYGWPNTTRLEVTEEEYSVKRLADKFFPDNLFEDWHKHTNTYVELRDEQGELSNSPFKGEKKQIEIHEIIYFLVVIMYMGVIRLPNKRAYWSTHHLMPTHPMIITTGLTRHRFEYIWRNFHLTAEKEEGLDPVEEAEAAEVPDGDESEVSEDEYCERDYDIQSQSLTKLRWEAEEAGLDEASEDADGDDEDSDDECERENMQDTPTNSTQQNTSEGTNTEPPRWFAKVSPLVDHVRLVSLFFVVVLGTCIAIDEMMIRFGGRSGHTHRIKNKPIAEGYKFFVACCSMTGYFLGFTPDGRGETGNEYSCAKKSDSKIAAMLHHVTKFLDDYISKGMEFVITLDNYFTYPKVMKSFRDRKIGMFGTARVKRGWPPAELKEERLPGHFNHFYFTIDPYNNMVGRWLDNSFVLVMSTVHSCVKSVMKKRRRPRENPKNKDHIPKVFGTHGFANICIPWIINTYNYWMGGVDRCDQMIAYYAPDLRCMRNWLPMWLQLVQILIVNMWIVYKTNDLSWS